MKQLTLLVPFLLWSIPDLGQDTSGYEKGSVTYLTSQSVYVRFPTTQHIQPGDTLFLNQAGKLIPGLLVREKSSISCVCTFLSETRPSVNDPVYFRLARSTVPVSQKPGQPAPLPADTGKAVIQPVLTPVSSPDTANPEKGSYNHAPQVITGFASVSSFTNLCSSSSLNSQRMKYTLSFNIRNIAGSNISFESYLAYTHDNRNWSEIQSTNYNGLKVYNLAANYTFLKHYSIWLGRRINPKISNMGPSDGLLFEMGYKPVTIGLIAGYRPNYTDYSFDSRLFQYGGYLYNETHLKHGYLMTTLGYIEQTNSGSTDRRFLYLQHSNMLVKGLTFYGTAEVDLYNKILHKEDTTIRQDNAPKLTNIYVSLNWRASRKLSMSVSYSARQTVIFYETYKTFLEQLLDFQRLQGYLLQVTYRPLSRLSLGLTSAYRFMKQDPRPTANLNAWVTVSRIPGLDADATVTATILRTGWISGQIYGLGLNRDFAKGKLSTGAGYKYVDYTYTNGEAGTFQNVAEAELTWRIIRKLFISAYYEGTFEKPYNFTRIYAQLNYRW
jgi:hypothetical protein